MKDGIAKIPTAVLEQALPHAVVVCFIPGGRFRHEAVPRLDGEPSKAKYQEQKANPIRAYFSGSLAALRLGRHR
jgi:hypothetical protein